MDTARSRPTFPELVALVDRMLDDCEEDVECIAIHLGKLEPEIRNELLVSDLLNAWQVFYYCFRTDPGMYIREKLDLEPASVLAKGLMIEEMDLLELHMAVKEGKAILAIWDGEKSVASFSGKNAFRDARNFLENPGGEYGR